jgi:hypothetical protein
MGCFRVVAQRNHKLYPPPVRFIPIEQNLVCGLKILDAFVDMFRRGFADAGYELIGPGSGVVSADYLNDDNENQSGYQEYRYQVKHRSCASAVFRPNFNQHHFPNSGAASRL